MLAGSFIEKTKGHCTPGYNHYLVILIVAFILCGTSTLTAQTITSLSANSLAQAGRLQITGNGFGFAQGQSTVAIGGASAPVSTWSDTSITAYVPDAAPLGKDNVQVITNSGSSNALPLTVTARQAGGQVLWRLQLDGLYIQGRPAVAADGTVYAVDVKGHLYAVTANGGVKWIFSVTPNNVYESVDVGPDGTIYWAGLNVIYAINPDGTEKWRLTDPSGALVDVGPTVGPDGNIYAVTGDGGLPKPGFGSIVISPAGQIINQKTGFFPGRGDDLFTREMVFGAPSQYYFSLNNVDNNSGLQFFQLGGNYLRTRLASEKTDPDTAPDGTIYAVITENELGAWAPDGSQLDTFFLGNGINTSLTTPSIGSDGTIYIGENFPNQIVALTAAGSQKWAYALRGNTNGPVVNEANTQVVVGDDGFQVPSNVQGINAATGKADWKVALPIESGNSVNPMSRARFSIDGSAVYMGMAIVGQAPPTYSYLYAFSTGPQAPELASLSLNPKTLKGGATSKGTVTLTATAPTGGIVVDLHSGNTSVAAVPKNVTVAAGQSTATFTVRTRAVTSNTSVTISARYNGVTKNATLTVTP